MALHKEKQTQTQTAPQPQAVNQPQAAPVVAPEQPQAQSQTNNESTFFQNQFTGFGSTQLDTVRNTLFKPLGGSAVNERITKIHQFFSNLVEEKRRTDPNVMDVRFVVAPSSRINNLYGGIIVTIPVNTPNGVALGFHLMITENSLQYNKQTESINGVNYSVYNTPSNTVTPDTIKAVEHLAKTGSGFSNVTNTVYGGFSVIPKEINLEDETLLGDLLDNAAGAVLSAIQLKTGDVENDIALVLANAIRSNELKVYANLEEKPQNTTDIAGLPIRSDFTIKTVATQNNTQNQQFQAIDIGTVNLFCAPVYSQPAQIPTPNGITQGTRAYYNQIIIRDIKTGPEIRLSPSSLFLLLATTGLLTQNGLWKRKYVPNMHIPSGQVDIGDIGAFGYEVPQLTKTGRPEMVNTKTAEFDLDTFNRYINAAFHEQIIYQIDIPDGNYLMGILLAEADGQQGARDIIFNLINRMTNGAFANQFGGTEQMFINTNLRVFTGHYMGHTSKKLQPLEDLDHLAMLNLTNGDTRSIQDFESSFVNAQSSALAIAIRTAITEELTGGSMEIRGYATRLTISPRFMEALINSLRSANLFPEINSNFARNQTYSRPSVDFWNRYAVDPTHINNLFGGHQQYGGMPNAGNIQQGYMGFSFR